MSDTNSPTCILSSSCLGTTPASNQLVSISSGVDSSRLARCGSALYSGCPHNESTPLGGVGASGTLPSNANYSCGCNPAVNNFPVSPGQENEDQKPPSAPKSPRSTRTSGWKTSKFFSKSMTSGEILRGLKKLSLSSSSSNNSNSEDQQQQQQPPVSDSNNKSLKSRLANFKKRSSYGNDEVSTDTESLDKQPTPSKSLDNSKNTQDEGIVCKKEDLKALICSATKRLPLCSPRKKRALRQTKSASFEPPTVADDKSKKEPVRRAGSEESRTRRTNSTTEKDQSVVKTETTVPTIKETKKPVIVEPTIPPVAAAEASAEVAVRPACASKVKWDDSNVVDAVLIGDAIESFLKVSMSSDKDTKLFPKMAFRKNSFEKKA